MPVKRRRPAGQPRLQSSSMHRRCALDATAALLTPASWRRPLPAIAQSEVGCLVPGASTPPAPLSVC